MFFTDREKQIYTAPDGRVFDPLRVNHSLTVESGNKFDDLIRCVNAARVPRAERTGDVSTDGRNRVEVEAAIAECTLADVARKVFAFPPASDPVDAVVLETLYHFLAWLEGKDSTAGTPQES